jgi:hypothetical protein
MVLVCVLAACAHQPPPVGELLPGPFLGLLHGYISLFALIASLFSPIRIYAFPNAGFLYDFGFVVGAYAFYRSGQVTYRSTAWLWR